MTRLPDITCRYCGALKLPRIRCTVCFPPGLSRNRVQLESTREIIRQRKEEQRRKAFQKDQERREAWHKTQKQQRSRRFFVRIFVLRAALDALLKCIERDRTGSYVVYEDKLAALQKAVEIANIIHELTELDPLRDGDKRLTKYSEEVYRKICEGGDSILQKTRLQKSPRRSDSIEDAAGK